MNIYCPKTLIYAVCRVFQSSRYQTVRYIHGDAETNLKVGGGHVRNFLVMPFHFFGSIFTFWRFGERFRGGKYILVSFLFAVLLLAVPPCPAICISGGHVPPCPMESAPLPVTILWCC